MVFNIKPMSNIVAFSYLYAWRAWWTSLSKPNCLAGKEFKIKNGKHKFQTVQQWPVTIIGYSYPRKQRLPWIVTPELYKRAMETFLLPDFFSMDMSKDKTAPSPLTMLLRSLEKSKLNLEDS